jgi:hypothetical protein
MNVRKAFLGFVTAAALAGMAPVAQGIQFPIRYDPDFDGLTIVDIFKVGGTSANPCTSDADGFQDCAINLVIVDVMALTGPSVGCHFTSGPITGELPGIGGIGGSTYFTAGRITQFSSGLIALTGSGDGCPSSADLQFTINDPLEPPDGFNPNFPGTATLTIGDADLTSRFVVPEPGTMALLFAALGFGWLTRRRTATA